MNENKRIPSRLIDAYVHHYGWVKDPVLMDRKLRHLSSNWMGKAMRERIQGMEGVFDYSEFDSLKLYTGTHPVVMQKRIASKNWDIEIDVSRKRFTFSKWIMYLLEKLTGRRLFSFRNYELI